MVKYYNGKLVTDSQTASSITKTAQNDTVFFDKIFMYFPLKTFIYGLFCRSLE